MIDYFINDSNFQEVLRPNQFGEQVTFGAIPRDYIANPMGCYASSVPWSMDIPTIPQNEWSDRIKEMERDKSRLSDIRNRADMGSPMKSLDQNGQGFCWAYSTTAAVMLLRAAANMPYVRLSPHAVAMKIYGRDRGAWGALSLDFIAKSGVPSQAFWPQQSMDMQTYDKPGTWENAKLFRVTEGWQDLNLAAYDRKLSFAQVATCLLSRIPVVCDLNWWGHSVCGMDLVETSPGKFGVRILNSWSDNWGVNGTGVLEGSKAIPDGACAPRAVIGS